MCEQKKFNGLPVKTPFSISSFIKAVLQYPKDKKIRFTGDTKFTIISIRIFAGYRTKDAPFAAGRPSRTGRGCVGCRS